MPTLTPDGQSLVHDLAQRHRFSEEAVAHMLAAVVAGHGRMAQFAHPEFGGNGQWMSGGMLMLGDMFNHSLKGRVAELCAELSVAVASVPPPESPPYGTDQRQRQSQGDSGSQAVTGTPFFESAAVSTGWPKELGTPTSSGSQNSTRYAFFASARRLAVDAAGDVTVYDTLDHRISGFSQQQGDGSDISIVSQHGRIDLASLPVVSPDELPQHQNSIDTVAGAPTSANQDDPVHIIMSLGKLHEQGLLTDEEFTTKKQELLARL